MSIYRLLDISGRSTPEEVTQRLRSEQAALQAAVPCCRAEERLMQRKHQALDEASLRMEADRPSIGDESAPAARPVRLHGFVIPSVFWLITRIIGDRSVHDPLDCMDRNGYWEPGCGSIMQFVDTVISCIAIPVIAYLLGSSLFSYVRDEWDHRQGRHASVLAAKYMPDLSKYPPYPMPFLTELMQMGDPLPEYDQMVAGLPETAEYQQILQRMAEFSSERRKLLRKLGKNHFVWSYTCFPQCEHYVTWQEAQRQPGNNHQRRGRTS